MIQFHKSDTRKKDYGTYYYTNFYNGFMDMKGKIVFLDTNFKSAEDFSENRTFVGDRNGNYSIVNTKGNQISKHQFRQFTPFKNGIALVQSLENEWGIIDTTGKFLVKPKYKQVSSAGMLGDYFFYNEFNEEKRKELTGIVRKDGKVICKNILEHFDSRGFTDGLLKCMIDGKQSYVNRSGKIVWQEKKSKSRGLKPMNIDHMQDGYFLADTDEAEKDPWRIRTPINPSKSSAGKNGFETGVVCVKVDASKRAPFWDEYNGYAVYVANQTKDEQYFNVRDGCLSMVVQAKNPKGKWQDIGYLSSSWCGNSYGKNQLNPGNYWELSTPEYEGEFKTMLRLMLRYIDPADANKEITIYSNEYDGSVNPGQFWRNETHYASNIMDPYSSLESPVGYYFPPIVPLAYTDNE